MLESDEERSELPNTRRTREWVFEWKRRRFWVRTTLNTFEVLKYYFLSQVFFSFLFCYILKMVFFLKKKKKIPLKGLFFVHKLLEMFHYLSLHFKNIIFYH